MTAGRDTHPRKGAGAAVRRGRGSGGTASRRCHGPNRPTPPGSSPSVPLAPPAAPPTPWPPTTAGVGVEAPVHPVCSLSLHATSAGRQPEFRVTWAEFPPRADTCSRSTGHDRLAEPISDHTRRGWMHKGPLPGASANPRFMPHCPQPGRSRFPAVGHQSPQSPYRRPGRTARVLPVRPPGRGEPGACFRPDDQPRHTPAPSRTAPDRSP